MSEPARRGPGPDERATGPSGLGDRSAYPDLKARAYLNHAAVSPPSLQVREAVRRMSDDYAARGVGALFAAVEQRQRLREQLARLIGAPSGRTIALVPSTTRAVTDLALCFPWDRAGRRVLVSQGEFPANVTPWQQIGRLHDLELAFLPQPEAGSFEERWWPAFVAALERGAALVAVSAVQFQTGFRMPLTRIGEACRAHGAQLFVDAIQAGGIVPLDVVASGIDYLACGSHKWLMAFEGIAFLYVSPERVDALHPHVAGWLSHEDGLSFLSEGPGHLRYDRPIRRAPSMFEGSSTNALGCAALEASVTTLLALGIDTIFDHVNRYLDPLEAALVARGFRSRRAAAREQRSGILSVLPPASVDLVALHDAIDPVIVACSIPDGHLRFSPHHPNHPSELADVLAEIDAKLARVAKT